MSECIITRLCAEVIYRAAANAGYKVSPAMRRFHPGMVVLASVAGRRIDTPSERRTYALWSVP